MNENIIHALKHIINTNWGFDITNQNSNTVYKTIIIDPLKFYFEFMMYKSSWKLSFIQIFAQNVFLVLNF